MICAGIDAGSRTVKAVVIAVETDSRHSVLSTGVADSGTDQAAQARRLFDDALDRAGLSEDAVDAVVATGYARHLLPFAGKAVTEITCHARGVRCHVPEARTIVEIGGQDSKVIRLDEQGRVEDFSMNDRCAAGTGCFLELVARRLEVDLNALGELAAASEQPADISSMCAVFAETEIVGLIAAGQPPRDIAAGVQAAIARRIAGMAGRAWVEPIVFTGGVARAGGMERTLAHALDAQVTIPPQPQLTGALGAALLAAEASAAMSA